MNIWCLKKARPKPSQILRIRSNLLPFSTMEIEIVHRLFLAIPYHCMGTHTGPAEAAGKRVRNLLFRL